MDVQPKPLASLYVPKSLAIKRRRASVPSAAAQVIKLERKVRPKHDKTRESSTVPATKLDKTIVPAIKLETVPLTQVNLKPSATVPTKAAPIACKAKPKHKHDASTKTIQIAPTVHEQAQNLAKALATALAAPPAPLILSDKSEPTLVPIADVAKAVTSMQSETPKAMSIAVDETTPKIAMRVIDKTAKKEEEMPIATMGKAQQDASLSTTRIASTTGKEQQPSWRQTEGKFRFRKHRADAVAPMSLDIGVGICAPEAFSIAAGQQALIETGLSFSFVPHTYGRLTACHGLAQRHGLWIESQLMDGVYKRPLSLFVSNHSLTNIARVDAGTCLGLLVMHRLDPHLQVGVHDTAADVDVSKDPASSSPLMATRLQPQPKTVAHRGAPKRKGASTSRQKR